MSGVVDEDESFLPCSIPGCDNIFSQLFEVLFQENINVVLITQASSEHSICVAIASEDEEKAGNP